ncbi:hypothetical protein BST47_07700 [Mycolicibacterium tusciae]|uniref:Uncharacterized protein n=1 Tax=Mycolicibacterium tusciae TaxID=75922 RepID=A0A1X0JVW1_9MYCO|nr:hypothetical protein BST47_07700 [Mycolicibacterium tusciae]
MVPLLVAVVALGGVGLGTWVTSENNRASIDAQRDQSDQQFRRDQRQDHYAAILQQATRLENSGSFSTSAFGALAAAGTLAAGFDRMDHTHAGIESPATGTTPSGSVPPADGGVDKLGDPLTSIGGIRDSWQSAYTALDQAISNAEIASTTRVINLAHALRDKYRNDYYESVLAEIDSSFESWPDPKPDRLKLAELLVGVPAETSPPSYDQALLAKSTDELTTEFVRAAKQDLDLDDQ